MEARTTDSGSEARVRAWTSLIQEAAEAYGVPAGLIAGTMLVESGGNPTATGPDNPGYGPARGLMQILGMHFGSGEDPYDPRTNVFRGAQILRRNYDRWGTWEQAIAAYFGALDAQGRITPAQDATGTPGPRYLALVKAAWERFRDLEVAVNPSEAPSAKGGGLAAGEIGGWEVAHAFLTAYQLLGPSEKGCGEPQGPAAYSGNHAIQKFARCTMLWDGRLHILNWEV